MLSVQQRLGLDTVILHTTTKCGGSLHENTYHPLHYTHNSDSHANLCKSFAAINSVFDQRGEVSFAEYDYSQDIAPSILPTSVLLTTKGDPHIQTVPDYIARKVLHTLSTVFRGILRHGVQFSALFRRAS